MLSKSKKHNANYLCKIIEVKGLRKHPNADRLMVFTVDGNDVITSNQTAEGTICIYFPLECRINTNYLKANNEFRHPEENADPEKKGFFDTTGRVKAVKLRGQKSEGYITPIQSLEPLIGDKWIQLSECIGEEFDTVGDLLLAQKYVVRNTEGSGQTNPNQKKKSKSKIIENQFALHYDTSQLGKNLFKLSPDSIISLSWKMHGTSFVSSKPLCNRKLSIIDRVAQWCGARIQSTVYENIYASRKVIKNSDINKTPQHYYGYDLWKDINDRFVDNLLDGETIYGECVGFTKDGKTIQKGYDYGCAAGQSEVYVYRITHTSTQGKVIDLPMNMVAERCVQLGVNVVPEIYFGPARGLLYTDKEVFEDTESVNTYTTDVEEWREAFFNFLKASYVYDQDCQFCKTKVPAEGLVLRVEGLRPEAFKLKAFRFLEAESKELDKEEENIEDNQTAEESAV